MPFIDDAGEMMWTHCPLNGGFVGFAGFDQLYSQLKAIDNSMDDRFFV